MARVTMEDVAKRAGVTRRYVSGILNGNSSVRVSEDTRRKVLEIVKELNYRQDHAALSLKTGKNFCIGVAGVGSLSEMNSISPATIFAGIGEVAEKHDYYLTFVPLKTDLEESVLRIAKSRVVDGLIINLYHHHYQEFKKNTLPVLEEANIPFAVVSAARTMFRCDHVGFDARMAGTLATDHLLEKGYTDIAMISPDTIGFGEEIRNAYQAAMERAGLPVQHHIMNGTDPYKAVSGYATGRTAAIGNDVHRAYICFSDMFGHGFARALEEAGLRIPDDVALVTLGDAYGDGRLGIPQLTTVRTKGYERGVRAAETLFAQLDADGTAPRKRVRVILKPELIVRESD